MNLVVGDTAPTIRYRITRDGATVDLTGVTEVRFRMRKADDRRFQIDGTGSVDGDPEDGVVKYTPGSSDLTVEGVFQARWRITFAGGAIEHTAPFEVEVERA